MKIQDLALTDITGAIAQFENYIHNALGYDEKAVKVEIEIKGGYLEITLQGCDKFWSQIDYKDQYRMWIWERADMDGDWESLLRDVWLGLQKHLPRAARELRYSLICLGKVTGQDLHIESASARAVFGQIRELKEKLAEKLLEYTPGEEPLPHTAPVAGPSEPKVELGDEISF